MRDMETEYDRLLKEKASQLRDECHAELLTAQGHVGDECHQALARRAVAEQRVALADRRVINVELTSEQCVKVVTSRERLVREQ